MSPLIPSRPGPVLRPFAALALLALCVSSAAASPLAPFTTHAGENHALEDHHAQDLRGVDLTLADISQTDFHAAALKDAILAGAVAVGADFSAADVKDVNFSHADLTDADLSGADAKNALFTDAVLWGASLRGANVKNADFRGAHLLGADLMNVGSGDLADFTGAYFDADTELAPSIDDSVMEFVVGVCPTDSSQYWIDEDRDGDGDECDGTAPLPEPGGAALLAGGALVAALGRRRA
jgi:uncharacterized protein YjbI with pentapeptide repeats